MVGIMGDIFRNNYRYNKTLATKIVKRVQSGSTSNGAETALKLLLFKMMKKLVKKNSFNYINLLNGIQFEELPTSAELISDCYMVFDVCVSKFKTDGGYDFYFYYNKALSRNFYENYRRKSRAKEVKMFEWIDNVNDDMRVKGVYDSIDSILNRINFSELELRVIKSKIDGISMNEFLKLNEDITQLEFNKSLKKVRHTLLKLIENGRF